MIKLALIYKKKTIIKFFQLHTHISASQQLEQAYNERTEKKKTNRIN